MPLQLLVKNYLGSLVYPDMTSVLSWISVMAYMLVFAHYWDTGLCLARRLFP